MSTRAQIEIQQIVDRLALAIVEHRLPPGARLTEAKLVEALGANRNHVRAALQRLATEQKIVSILPNRGAFVASPTVDEARQVFEARMILERAIISLAVRNLTPRNKNRLLKQLEKETESLKTGKRQEMIRESGQFHKLLALIAGNQVLAELLDGLITRSSLILALYQAMPHSECSIDEHQALTNAVLAGDEARAVSCMDHHMHTLEQSLLLDKRSTAVDLTEALSV